MSIKSNIPQIAALRSRVEERFGKALAVHADFVALVTEIETTERVHVSESTLERLWGYSTRGYETVSLHTLDLLSGYACGFRWLEFCRQLHEKEGCESDMFNAECVHAADLSAGDRLQFGWLPDRLCIVRYLGDNRFVAEECCNSKMQPGDTFSCMQFTLGKELVMSDFRQCGSQPGSPSQNYAVGSKHGLTTLQRME